MYVCMDGWMDGWEGSRKILDGSRDCVVWMYVYGWMGKVGVWVEGWVNAWLNWPLFVVDVY